MSEIVLVAGPPGGGKSTHIKALVDQGYRRINRDEIGGGLSAGDQAYSILRMAHAAGDRLFVADNVYATIESRKVIIDEAVKLGLSIRILWLDTTAEQAQFFAARRQVQRLGKLLAHDEYKAHSKDPNMFPPVVQFAYWKKVEPPTLAEGFVAIDHVPVKIDLGPEYVNEAVIFDYDGTLRDTISGDLYPTTPTDIRILPGRAEKLAELTKRGVLLLGASNQSGVARKPSDPKYVSDANVRACFDRTNELLGAKIEYLFAPEPAGAPASFWRKPCPGMGVVFIEKYKLDPSKCLYVGDMTSDATFAKRCGFQYMDANVYF